MGDEACGDDPTDGNPSLDADADTDDADGSILMLFVCRSSLSVMSDGGESVMDSITIVGNWLTDKEEVGEASTDDDMADNGSPGDANNDGDATAGDPNDDGAAGDATLFARSPTNAGVDGAVTNWASLDVVRDAVVDDSDLMASPLSPRSG